MMAWMHVSRIVDHLDEVEKEFPDSGISHKYQLVPSIPVGDVLETLSGFSGNKLIMKSLTCCH